MAGEANLSILVKIKNEAQKGLEQLNKQLQESQKEGKKAKEVWDAIGKAGAVMGGAIVGAFGMMAKAAEGDRRSSAKLAQMLKNVGVAYDDVKDSLEATIKATAKKTGIADEDQREALSQLIMVTGDYKESLDALPAVLDLAAARGMDVSSAAVAMGRALNGDTAILKRYGIALEDGADATEVLAAITKSCGGAAEAMASPFSILKNEVDEMGESIGGLLLPALSGMIRVITTVVGGIAGFIDKSGIMGNIIAGLIVTVGLLALGVAAYAAATNSATIAMIAHIVQLGLAMAAKIATTVATVGLTAAVSGYAASLWAAVAAQAALLAPLAIVVGILAGVGLAVYGLVKWMDTLTSSTNGATTATNQLYAAVATLRADMEFYKGKLDETNAKIAEEQGKLQGLETELGYVTTAMIDAFGISRVNEINTLKAALEAQQTTINNMQVAIDAAKRELQGFLNPNIEGMNAADAEINRISGNIDVLNLKKLLVQAKADTTEVDARLAELDLADVDFTVSANMEGIDSAIAKEQQAYDIATLTRDVKFDPLVTEINTAAEAALGMNQEMAPADILARITQLSSDIGTNQSALASVQAQATLTNAALSVLESSVQISINDANSKIAAQNGLILGLQIAARGYKAKLEQITAEWGDAQRAVQGYTRAAAAASYFSDTTTAPAMASGGIVTKPTMALIGEAGPEAVIPLNRLGSGGATYVVNISAGAFVGSRAEADSFANMILGSLRTKQRYALGAAQW